MPNKELFAATIAFHKLAQSISLSAELATTVSNLRAKLMLELSSGINAINHLMTTDKVAASSEGILAVDSSLGKMSEYVQSLTTTNMASNCDSILEFLGQAMFRTSPTNAGMGYDSNTRKGGTASPGAAVDRMFALAKKLESLSKTNA